MESQKELSVRMKVQILTPIMIHLVLLCLTLGFLSSVGVFDFSGKSKSLILVCLQFGVGGGWMAVWADFAKRQYQEQKPIGKIRRILLGW